MERDTILERTKNIAIKIMGEIPDDHHVWEGFDSGAKFIVSKEIYPIEERYIFYSLSVSGPLENRRKLIQDFIDALGKPTTDNKSDYAGAIEFVLWNADQVDTNRKSNS